MLLMPTLGKQRLVDMYEFKVILVFIVLGQSRLCSETCLQKKQRREGKERKQNNKIMEITIGMVLLHISACLYYITKSWVTGNR